MKVLKVTLLVFLGIFLALSLLIFGALLTVNLTALNPDFVVSQVNRLDISAIADELIIEELPPETEDLMGDVLYDVSSDTIADMEPWMKQQARDGIYIFYDYLEGRSQSLHLTIPLETLEDTLRENLLAAILASPPPELAGLSPTQIEQEFNQQWIAVDEAIPDTIDLDETLLDAEIMEQIEQAKQIIGYVNLGFKVMIGFILLLILLIILTYRTVRGSSLHLGITFLGCGVVYLIGTFVGKSNAQSQLAQLTDMPTAFNSWVPQLINDVFNPMLIYSICLLAVGVGLVLLGVLYKRGQDYYY